MGKVWFSIVEPVVKGEIRSVFMHDEASEGDAAFLGSNVQKEIRPCFFFLAFFFSISGSCIRRRLDVVLAAPRLAPAA